MTVDAMGIGARLRAALVLPSTGGVVDGVRPVEPDVLALWSEPMAVLGVDGNIVGVPVGIPIPSYDVIMGWLERSGAERSVVEYVASLPRLSNVVSSRSFTDEEMAIAVDTLLWGGSELTSRFDIFESSRTLISSDLVALIRSGWRNDSSISVLEMKALYLMMGGYFDVDTVTVGEMAFMSARRRDLLATKAWLSGGVEEYYDWLMTSFRARVADDSAVLWTLLANQYVDAVTIEDSSGVGQWIYSMVELAGSVPVDAVLGYFDAGIWDVEVVVSALAADIDPAMVSRMMAAA